MFYECLLYDYGDVVLLGWSFGPDELQEFIGITKILTDDLGLDLDIDLALEESPNTVTGEGYNPFGVAEHLLMQIRDDDETIIHLAVDTYNFRCLVYKIRWLPGPLLWGLLRLYAGTKFSALHRRFIKWKMLREIGV